MFVFISYIVPMCLSATAYPRRWICSRDRCTRWIFVAAFLMKILMDLSCRLLSTSRTDLSWFFERAHKAMPSTVIFGADQLWLRLCFVMYITNSWPCNRCGHRRWCDEYYWQHSPIPAQPAHNCSTHLGNVVRSAPNCRHFLLKRKETQIFTCWKCLSKFFIYKFSVFCAWNVYPTNEHIANMCFSESSRYHSTVHACEKNSFRLQRQPYIEQLISTSRRKIATNVALNHKLGRKTYMRIIFYLNEFFNHLFARCNSVPHYSPDNSFHFTTLFYHSAPNVTTFCSIIYFDFFML